MDNELSQRTDACVQRTEVLLAGEKRLLEMVALGSPLPAVLDALCHLAAQVDEGCHGGIRLIDPVSKTFQRGGASTLASAFIDATSGSPVYGDSGPCGAAASLKAQVIVLDVASESRWTQRWRDISLAHGLRACWSTPILSRAKEVLGVFTICRREAGEPTPFQSDLIAQLSHLASIAIERARSDDAMKRSEEGFRAIWDTTPECVKVVARDGTVLRVNEASAVVAQAPSTDALVGTCFFDFVAPEHRQRYVEFHQRVCSGQRGFLEFDLISAKGDRRHMETHAAPMEIDGAIVQLGVTRDITQRKQAEETLGTLRAELAHLSRVTSLGAVTASITHEISQPLAGITTNASTCQRMLSADPPNVEGALETVRRTIRDGRRASDVITRLRALFSKKAVVRDAVDLNEAAREVVELLRMETSKNRIAVRLELADNLPPVNGDRVQLQQVVLNLLLNAADAMKGIDDRPRHLLVKSALEGDNEVRLAVTDTGVGIEPEHTAKVFEAFYTTKKEGMGIGLSVCRSIIESHGGRMSAGRNDNGIGATFAFSIPRQSGRPAIAAAA